MTISRYFRKQIAAAARKARAAITDAHLRRIGAHRCSRKDREAFLAAVRS